MATKKRQMKMSRRAVLWGMGGLLWLGLLVGVAVPSWRRAVQQHHQVQTLAIQLEELDNWAVAGLWLEQTLAPRQNAINPQWERLFPEHPRKGELFLDLARVADNSGVDDFKLQEMFPPGGAAVLEPVGGDPVPLTAYRVRADFTGKYAQVAKFLGGLKVIQRAVSVHNLAIKPARGAVQVELELDVYVGTPDQS